MPLTYLESSALVKRYVPEAGSDWVTVLFESEPIALSLLSVAEVASALARRTREGVLTEQRRDTLFRLFARDTAAFVVIELNRTVMQQAAQLLLTAPPPLRLRSLKGTALAAGLGRAHRRDNPGAVRSVVLREADMETQHRV